MASAAIGHKARAQAFIKTGEGIGKTRRRGDRQVQASASGMLKPDACGVEEQPGGRLTPHGQKAAILGIAHDRRPEQLEMGADLVHPPGLGAGLHKVIGARRGEKPEDGAGRLSALLARPREGHALHPVRATPPDKGEIARDFRLLKTPVGESQIGLLDAPTGERGRKRRRIRLGAGCKDQPRGLRIKPVHKPRTLPVGPGEGDHQLVKSAVAGIAGLDRQARGLVEGEDSSILMNQKRPGEGAIGLA